jgi:hypothetical protein
LERHHDPLCRTTSRAAEGMPWRIVVQRLGRNVFGAAVQLCALLWLGYVPDGVRTPPDVAAAAKASSTFRSSSPVGGSAYSSAGGS